MLARTILTFILISACVAENNEASSVETNLTTILQRSKEVEDKLTPTLELGNDNLNDDEYDDDSDEEGIELEDDRIRNSFDQASLNNSEIIVKRPKDTVPLLKPAKQIDEPVGNVKNSDINSDGAVVLPSEINYVEKSEITTTEQTTTTIQAEQQNNSSEFFGNFEKDLRDGWEKTSDKAIEVKEYIEENPKSSSFVFGFIAGVVSSFVLYSCCVLLCRRRSTVQPHTYGVTDDLYETSSCSQQFTKNSAITDRDERTMQLMSPASMA